MLSLNFSLQLVHLLQFHLSNCKHHILIGLVEIKYCSVRGGEMQQAEKRTKKYLLYSNKTYQIYTSKQGDQIWWLEFKKVFLSQFSCPHPRFKYTPPLITQSSAFLSVWQKLPPPHYPFAHVIVHDIQVKT